MKTPLFTGSGVAVITPTNADDSVNFSALTEILEDQIAKGTDAIIICGTTGEASALTDEEQIATIAHAVKVVNHRIPVIAGTGSNDTPHGCALSKKAAQAGVDGLLLVTPYYNKTNQEGLIKHFNAQIEAAGIPVILYNVPSRTGMNIAPETAKKLSENPLVVGLKEASGNLSQVAKIASLCGDELPLYSGNDDQILPVLSLGGKGVISVTANVVPTLIHECCAAWFAGDVQKSTQIQLDTIPLCDALFCDVNPIPVKHAMNLMGWNAGACRMPLAETSPANKEKITQSLKDLGVLS